MKTIKLGSKGPDVERWQYFLIGEGFRLVSDGDFGPKTSEATKTYQSGNGLTADGIVGPNTWTHVTGKGFTHHEGVYLGSDPLSYKDRLKLFGEFEFDHTPSESNPEKITVNGDWKKENIIRIMPDILCPKFTSSIQVHKLVAHQFRNAFKEIAEAGLDHLVLSYGGTYNARYIRGSRKTLSNHAHGTAIDINMKWNGLGKIPSFGHGSVRELVPIFENNGFYWGGNFRRKDGMHFEINAII